MTTFIHEDEIRFHVNYRADSQKLYLSDGKDGFLFADTDGRVNICKNHRDFFECMTNGDNVTMQGGLHTVAEIIDCFNDSCFVLNRVIRRLDISVAAEVFEQLKT